MRTSYWNRIHPRNKSHSAKTESEYLRTYGEILEAKSLTLWLTSDVDGLVLAAWLAFVHETCQTGCEFQLIQFPRRLGPKLAILSDKVLADPPAPQRVHDKTLEFLLEFWRAWTAPTPHLLVELSETATSNRSRRSLIAALLNRYPDSMTGLTSWDHALLQSVHENGPRLADVVAKTSDRSDLENVSTAWLLSRLNELAKSDPSGGFLKVDCPDPDFPYKGTVTLTTAGHQVLSGEANAIGRYWVNDWVGGVQLAKSHSRWLRTQDGLVERSPA